MREYQRGESIGGEFEVLEVFGGRNRSGMGVVYLVRNRDVPFPFVLKTSQSLNDDTTKKRFAAEAHAWVRAGAHANIVQAYWVREITDQIFIAAEYVKKDSEGRNVLTDFISAGRLRLETVVSWSIQFCSGMNYAHSKGVLVHRDIKPDNLMIDPNWILKVTDFGLAKSIAADSRPRERGWAGSLKKRFWGEGGAEAAASVGSTQAGTGFGTLPYMAPEQFLDASSVDLRADIYSFGVILYQMASGNRYPYRIHLDCPDPSYEYFRAHSGQSPIPLKSPLDPIIRRCLQKRVGQRYPGYDALLSDLKDLARLHGITVPEEETISRQDEELYAQAQSYVALGDKERAHRTISAYVSKYPERACGWVEKGRIHYERAEYLDGVEATRHALCLNPYNSHAWNNLGIGLNHTGASLNEIQTAFENALSFDPCNTAAMMNLVGPLVDHGRYEEAAKLTTKAMKLRPERSLIIKKAESLLQVCIEARTFPACVTLLDGWTEARPRDKDAWHNRGLFALQRRDLDQAITCFTRVRELSPDDNFAVTQLAKLYFEKMKGRECLECCNTLLERQHETLLAVTLRARAISFMGGYERAVHSLQPYLEANPRNDTLWTALAMIHEHEERFESAIEAFRRARLILEYAKRVEDVKFVEEGIRRCMEALSSSRRKSTT